MILKIQQSGDFYFGIDRLGERASVRVVAG